MAETLMKIRIRLLGRFEVAVNGGAVADSGWTRRHAATLVKLLALAPGRRMHREEVLDAVWPGDDIDAAVPKLHKAAHFARRATGCADRRPVRRQRRRLPFDDRPPRPGSRRTHRPACQRHQ